MDLLYSVFWNQRFTPVPPHCPRDAPCWTSSTRDGQIATPISHTALWTSMNKRKEGGANANRGKRGCTRIKTSNSGIFPHKHDLYFTGVHIPGATVPWIQLITYNDFDIFPFTLAGCMFCSLKHNHSPPLTENQYFSRYSIAGCFPFLSLPIYFVFGLSPSISVDFAARQ